MLRLSQVGKSYGAHRALKDVSFVARPGEVLGYLGPNGSGKSTTARILAGLLSPTRGTITYRGRDIREQRLEHRRRVGYVPETPELYGYLTGPEFLSLVGRLRGIGERSLEEKVERFLRLFGIHEDRHAPLSAFSKGMKQKILLSAALLHDPEVVILDEPSSGLDVTSNLLLRELVRALAEQGKIVLYSSHVLEMVEPICSSVVILRDGEVVAQGSIERLREWMQKPSLEQVFTALAVREDLPAVARELIEAMRLS